MRLSRADFCSPCKSFLKIEFAPQDISAFGGLELMRRYLALIELGRRVRTVFTRYGVGGDYRTIDMILVILVLILVGGRRLDHLNYVCDDPLVKRFCGLMRLPRERSVARWLKRFTHKSLKALVEINSQIVSEAIDKQSLARLTIDIDGSVITTGASVAWAFRGFNPHHRKDPSYYPILAHLAQSGHILRVKNRPGNVHDSKGAPAFIRELIDDVRARLGSSLPLEFRMDGAFFQREIINLLERRKVRYAIKVPFMKWLGLVPIIRERERWHRLKDGMGYFEIELEVAAWEKRLRVVVYRKPVHHHSKKNYQLDLFDPEDGYFEYSAVSTNLDLKAAALWDFMAGRGENLRRAQRAMGFGCGVHASLRGELGLAANLGAGAQPVKKLPAPDSGNSKAKIAQTDLPILVTQFKNDPFQADSSTRAHRKTPRLFGATLLGGSSRAKIDRVHRG